MKNIKNSFLVKFVVTLFLIGILVGILFFFSYKPDLSGTLSDFKNLLETTRQNTFFPNIVFISGIFILSVSLIGFPAILFYLFYEAASIGFAIGLFLFNYELKGLLFYLLFFIASKLIYTVIMIYFSIISLRFVVKMIEALTTKNKEEFYRVIVYHFYRFVIVLIIIILNSGMIYLFANKIIGLFINLIG